MPERQEQKILESFRQGKAPAAVKRAAARGTMPVAADELLEILVLLTHDPDPTCSEVAQETLASWPAEKCAELLTAPHTSPATLDYFARQATLANGLVAVVAAHPNTSDEVLTAMTPRLSLEQLEPLLGAEDRLLSLPAFVTAVLSRSDLPADLRTRLEGLRAEQQKKEQESAASLLAAAEEAATAAEKKTDKHERFSLTQKLSRMSVAERIQRALKGNREERSVLIRDPAKVIFRAVLQSPKLTDSEAESFATMKNVAEEVLRIIANTRKFMKSYIVVRNLVNNPRTPLDVSLPLLNRLTNQDLKFLTLNRNVPDTLRAIATKLDKQRSSQRKGGG
ncbi:MAG: hypothetical protein ACE5MH_01405 [Terriglobia bacterium]